MSEVVAFWLKIVLSLLIIIISVLLYFLEKWPSVRCFMRVQQIPGPKGVFYFGNAFELKDVPFEDFLIWLEKKFESYSRVMKIWILGIPNVYLKHPEDVQAILSNKKQITKGAEYNVISDWLDDGLLTASGTKWFSRRKLLTPAFHFKILENNLPVFNGNARKLMDKFKGFKGEGVCLDTHISQCTLDVIFTTAMGMNIDVQSKTNRDYVAEIKRVSEAIAYRFVRPHLSKDWIFALSPVGKIFWKAVEFLHKFSLNIIHERRFNEKLEKEEKKNNTPEHPEKVKVKRALLDTLLEIQRTQPDTLTDTEIRKEVDTFMFEGHDTTSVALCYIFFNLGRFEDIQAKVYDELYSIFGDDDRDVTTEDLSRMVYTEMVIKETLRLFPSVPYISRKLEEDLVLEDGYTIPAGSNLVLPIYIIHHNEKHWPDPLKFDPERFSEEQIKTRHPYAFIPFSAGSRNCIGQKFAMMEMKIVVATVVRNLKIVPDTRFEELKFILHMVLRTNKPIYCRFIPR